MNWISVGAGLSAFGVLLGAFGAHGLRARVTPEALKTWEVATLYLFVSAFGLLALGLLERLRAPASSPASLPGACLLLGCLLFSGSLYLHVLGGPRFLVMVTPVGGLLMILGWSLFAWYAR